MLNMSYQTTVRLHTDCYTLGMYLHTGTGHLNSQTGTEDMPEFTKVRRNMTTKAAKM